MSNINEETIPAILFYSSIEPNDICGYYMKEIYIPLYNITFNFGRFGDTINAFHTSYDYKGECLTIPKTLANKVKYICELNSELNHLKYDTCHDYKDVLEIFKSKL